MSWIDKVKDLHDRVTAARAGKLDYLQNLEDGIHFDSALGAAGTDWPIGTAQAPSNTIADVITMCTARKIKKIYVGGSVTLGAAMQGYTFIGLNDSASVNLGSQNVGSSCFKNLTITGTQGGTSPIFCFDCTISSVQSLFMIGDGIRAGLSSPTTLKASCAQYWRRVEWHGDQISLAGCSNNSLYVELVNGTLLFGLLTDAGTTIRVFGHGNLTSLVTNTAGAIIAHDSIRFTARGGGATETDQSIYATLGTPAGASVSADIAALKTVADSAAAAAATAAAGVGTAPTDMALDSTVAKDATVMKAASYTAPDNTGITNINDVVKSGGTGDNAAIKAKTDKISLPIYRQVFKSADSAMLASLAFGSVAADKDFPSVVATAKPTGATITKAYWGFSYSKKVDSSDAANAVSAAGKAVRVKVSTGAWGTDDIVAYTFANGALSTPASATEGGMMIMGSVDIKSVVDGSAATFNFRSEETERSDALTVTGASLTFYDVESWLVIEYTL